MRRVTFFTHDADYYKRTWCHAAYCLVYMPVPPHEAAAYIRRILRQAGV